MKPALLSARGVLALACLVAWVGSAAAQVTSVKPRVCRPGETTRLNVSGKNLDGSLRVLASRGDGAIALESVAAEEAVILLSLPADFPPGPLAIWTATDSTVAAAWMLIVDDLPVARREQNNVTPESAQRVPSAVAIQGTSRGAESDFYRLRVEAGERLSFEVLTGDLHSPMDPLLRLWSEAGELLAEVDDDPVGPEARFGHRFGQAGDYLLEVRDSRYAAGGDYLLRIGDFPLLAHADPLGVRRGRESTVDFVTWDDRPAEPQALLVPVESLDSTWSVATRRPGGRASAWVPIHVTDLPVDETGKGDAAGEGDDAELAVPGGVGGMLDASGNPRGYRIRGVRGQRVRFDSRTRSLGSAALLRMRLLDPGGNVVAETAVGDDDQWGFDYTFPDDGEYRLRVDDLLARGGAGFGYWIEATPWGDFELQVKGDAKTPRGFLVDARRGAFAVDLQVRRRGYDGEIELWLAGDRGGLTLVNPRIPAKATEARVYIAAEAGWAAERLAAVRLVGRIPGDPVVRAAVASIDLHRLRTPHVPFPSIAGQGRLVVAGRPAADPLFALEPAEPLRLARPLRRHRIRLNLRRQSADFKAAVTLLPERLPAGVSGTFQAEGDVHTTELVIAADASPLPEEIELLAYGEHGGRGFLETVRLPVQWFDPLGVRVEGPAEVIAGSTAMLDVSVRREGPAADVTLVWQDLPEGIELPRTVTLAADQTSVRCPLAVARDFSSSQPLTLSFTAQSRLGDEEFTVGGRSAALSITPLPRRIEVYPDQIELVGGKSKRPLVVTGFDAAGTPRDWTHQARMTVADPGVAEVRDGVIYPQGDGETEIEVRVGEVAASVPVRVEAHRSERRTDFESEVLVALSKQGCNSGACHGSPSGKGMFRLSLRAFDRELDELTLIREESGRRINPVQPGQSLLLLKPLMKIAHGGGKQLHTDDVAYRILTDWIAEGARPDPDDAPRPVRLEIYPDDQRVLRRTAGRQQLSVTAHFSDGTWRDVTELAAYESSAPQIATVDGRGLVTARGDGEAVILVRLLEHIESVPLTFIDPDPEFVWRAPEPHNYVDELVYEKLRQMQLRPADLCSDAEFLRRVHLDIVGILPSLHEVREFLADGRDDKRPRLIDALLRRDEFAKFWALKWGDLLKLTGGRVGSEGVHKYHRWVERAVRDDMPYDEFARQLITASGSTLANPPANFYRTATDMEECVETVSQIFLGARLQCAKCHNHPFERWTQENYYGLGTFFQSIRRRQTRRPGEMFVWLAEGGQVPHPLTGQPVAPWLPAAEPSDIGERRDPRTVLADWLTSPDNPYFARVGANRVWSQLFARGIIDPIDDFRDSNPPTNPPLLAALAEDFRHSGYSTRHLLRTILNSRTYQASYRTDASNRDDTLYFSHQRPRLLKAEQLLDAVNHVTGLPQTFGPLPPGTKATQLPAPDLVPVDFLKTFGQPDRNTVCACERVGDSNLAMALELFTGPLIHGRLQNPENRFRRALAAGATADAVLDELYLAALCRPPTDDERAAAAAHLRQREDIAAGMEDICWALFNTDEFLFQH